jgi:hypothetical protein
LILAYATGGIHRTRTVQKAFTVKQGEDGVPVAEIDRKTGISQATYFN